MSCSQLLSAQHSPARSGAAGLCTPDSTTCNSLGPGHAVRGLRQPHDFWQKVAVHSLAVHSVSLWPDSGMADMAGSCSLPNSCTAGWPQCSCHMHPCRFLQPQPSCSGMPTSHLFRSSSFLDNSHPDPGGSPWAPVKQLTLSGSWCHLTCSAAGPCRRRAPTRAPAGPHVPQSCLTPCGVHPGRQTWLPRFWPHCWGCRHPARCECPSCTTDRHTVTRLALHVHQCARGTAAAYTNSEGCPTCSLARLSITRQVLDMQQHAGCAAAAFKVSEQAG